ncbi:ribosome recycling factor-domain-containing protein [Limtongia smithiae]|uniref:ribosome recycling factor-domain-containing protein n=1 Tax=Limtongia smithiae TaxID=1125753 RepID=UPI0034CF1FC0
MASKYAMTAGCIYSVVTMSLRRQLMCVPLRRTLMFSSGHRSFTCSTILYKKPNKKGPRAPVNDKSEDVEIVEIYDLQVFQEKCNKLIKQFTEKAQEVRMGQADVKVLSALKVPIPQSATTEYLSNMAEVALRGGRQLVVSIYDPDMVDAVSKTIIRANLNMNPQVDPANRQTLIIPVAAPTRESRERVIKVLRSEYDKTRGNNRGLASAREEALDELKKMSKAGHSIDVVRKLRKDIEKIAKTTTDKLTKVIDDASKLVMSS